MVITDQEAVVVTPMEQREVAETMIWVVFYLRPGDTATVTEI
jgi:hypothetical protein